MPFTGEALKKYRHKYRQREYVKRKIKEYKLRRKNSLGGEIDRIRQKQYYYEHANKRKLNSKNWKIANPNKVKEYQKKCYTNRKKNHITNLSDRLRQSIKHAFKHKGLVKIGRTFDLLKYQPGDLFNYLSQYMDKPCLVCNKVNININNADIDHIIPISSAITYQDIINLNQLSNIRLICHICNIKKSNKMEKSTHKSEVVEVNLIPHTNANNLSIVSIFNGGYTCVVNTKDWESKKKAVFICPDSLVDTTCPEFSFLAGEAKYDADSNLGGSYARIRAKKLRGVPSYGLLVPVPNDTELGTDMAEIFGVKHYEPVVAQSSNKDKTGFYSGGETASGPTVLSPKYDLDSFQRYAKQVFVDEEPVVVTEKINGANARYVYENGQMYCGSHYEWKKEFAIIPVPDKDDLINKLSSRLPAGTTDEIIVKADTIIDNINKKNAHPPQNLFWKAMRNTPGLAEWC
jgi:RNA ligase (TIGR02306 family)